MIQTLFCNTLKENSIKAYEDNYVTTNESNKSIDDVQTIVYTTNDKSHDMLYDDTLRVATIRVSNMHSNHLLCQTDAENNFNIIKSLTGKQTYMYNSQQTTVYISNIKQIDGKRKSDENLGIYEYMFEVEVTYKKCS